VDTKEFFQYVFDGEGQQVEFKRELPTNEKDIARQMAALTNTNGGILLIGVEDDGELRGVSDPDDVMKRIANAGKQSCKPPLYPSANRIRIDNKYFVWVKIEKERVPRLVRGIYYRRVGTTVQRMENGSDLMNLAGLRKQDPESCPPNVLPLSAEPPPVRNFKGRDAEVEQLLSYLEDERVSIIAIEGISGVGKTTIAAYLADKLDSRGYTSFWVECREDTVADTILWSLAGVARQNGDQGLANILEDTGRPFEERITSAAIALSKSQYVLFFDDYHLVVNPNINRFVRKIEHRSGLTRVVLSSRVRPDVLALVNPASTREVHLQSGLDIEACGQLLVDCGLALEPSLMEEVWHLTGKGHPRALLIFAARARNFSVSQLLQSLPIFRDELKQEWLVPLMNELPQELRDVTVDLSVFDRPLPFSAIQMLYPDRNIDDLILALIDRFILDRVDDRNLSMHGLLREHCYTLIEDLVSKHEWAAEYYLSGMGSVIDAEMMTDEQVNYCLAAWSHFVKAGKHERAVGVIDTVRKTLINQGQYEQLMFLIEHTDPPTEEDKLWFTINEARIFSFWGDQEFAVQLLQPLIENENPRFAREAVLVLASVYCEHDNAHKAIELLNDRSELFWGSDVSQLLKRRLLMRMVWAHRLTGDYDQALEWAKKVSEIAEVNRDKLSLAIALRDMAAVFQALAQLEVALVLFERSQELFDESHRMREAALTQVMLGELLEEMDSYEIALDNYEAAFQDLLRMGDRKNANRAWQKFAILKEKL
jgi:tetratricopeptide (TPR) repeat protein